MIDSYGRRVVTEDEAVDVLYRRPTVDFSTWEFGDPSRHNAAVKANYSELGALKQIEELTVSPLEWHHQNQTEWLMPDEYKNLDIARWVLEQCDGEAELQRAGAELLEYANRNLLDMLAYLKYLIDTLRENRVVWGVGRGSSVASFVLYKIGVHRINSLYYQLDFYEFMRSEEKDRSAIDK